MTPDVDLVIAGAGPAGAAAACHFARAGFRVVLIDQRHFPRDKVCGDFVGPWAMEELDRLDLSTDWPFRDANKIRHAALHLNGDKVVGASIPHIASLRDYGLCVPRVHMDNAIVNAAIASGARFIEGARVAEYDADANGVTVRFGRSGLREQLRTRLLVGADGSTSQIALILRGKKPPRRDRIVAVRAYFDNVNGDPQQAGLYANSSVFPGYYWLFPSGNGSANVGIGMLVETWPPNNQQLARDLCELIQSDAALRSRLRTAKIRSKIAGWPLATFNPHLPIVGDRVVLIGDAAGLINPLNGEGIQYALQSARWSIEMLRDPLSEDNVLSNGLIPYVNRVHAEMRFDMAVSRLLVDLTRNRGLNGVWLSALHVIGKRAQVDREYADIFGGVLAGIARARDALGMPFVWATVEQALTVGRSATRDAWRAGITTTRYSLGNRTATLDWAIQCAIGAFELAAQFAKQRATPQGALAKKEAGIARERLVL